MVVSTPLRIAVVDDHQLFRESLSLVLADRGCDVVGSAGDARACFPLIDRAHPDVVLLDLALPGLDGVTAAREIIARPAGPKVLMLSAYSAPHMVAAAFEAGVHGYALKSLALDELVGAIRTVARGERYLAPTLSAVAVAADSPLADLSPRERDLFRLFVGGATMSEVAAELCISIKTVETHRQRIFRKLNVHSAVQLVRFAVLNDLLVDRAVADDLYHHRG